MISEDITRDVAEAQVSDDCRVELWVADLAEDAVATLTPSQAIALGNELARAAQEAERAAEELLGERPPSSFDVAILSPDCAAGGKHRACIGTAWDLDKDELTNCTCECHAKDGAA